MVALFLPYRHIEAQQQLIEPKSLYINITNELDGAGVSVSILGAVILYGI